MQEMSRSLGLCLRHTLSIESKLGSLHGTPAIREEPLELKEAFLVELVARVGDSRRECGEKQRRETDRDSQGNVPRHHKIAQRMSKGSVQTVVEDVQSITVRAKETQHPIGEGSLHQGSGP